MQVWSNEAAPSLVDVTFRQGAKMGLTISTRGYRHTTSATSLRGLVQVRKLPHTHGSFSFYGLPIQRPTFTNLDLAWPGIAWHGLALQNGVSAKVGKAKSA